MYIGSVSSYAYGSTYRYNAKRAGVTEKSTGLSANNVIANLDNSAIRKTVSPAQGVLQSLYEQKKSLTQSKNELIADTLSSNKTLESIKPQLESYEERLKSLDTQIKEAFVEQKDTLLENTNGNQNKEEEPSLGEDTTMYQAMNAIMNSSASRARLAVMNSAKNRLDGEKRVIASEIKQDGFTTKTKSQRLDSLGEKLNKLSKGMESVQPEQSKEHLKVQNAVQEIIAKQDVEQNKINTYATNTNPPAEQYQRALINIMI